MNCLRKAVRDYLTMRRSLGFKLVKHEAGLQQFLLFLARKHTSHITVNLALEWATQDANHKPAEWASRLSIVRGFTRHWGATEPSTEIPAIGLLPYRPQRARPYFYSYFEIQKLLKAAKDRPSIDPLRPWTYYCLFGLLAVAGLRLGEALNLQTGDMDWSEGILTIKGAKFGKSRLVPLHTSTCRILAAYTKRRDRRFGSRSDGPSFVIRTVTIWTRVRCIGRSTSSPARSDCARWMRVAAPACTTFVTVLQSRRCCVGIAMGKIRSGACQSCPPIWGMPMLPTPIGTSPALLNCWVPLARGWKKDGRA